MDKLKFTMREPKLTNARRDFAKPADKQNDLLQSLGRPHIESFNYMLEGGLRQTIKNSTPIYLTLPNGDKVVIRIDDVFIEHPVVPPNIMSIKDRKIYPTQCRQSGNTYKGNLTIRLGWSINDIEQESFEKSLGEIPIMVKSNLCHLNKMSPAELIAHSEHEQEWGGYFIVKGLERILRMLIATRRNYPIAIKKQAWKARGEQFSDLGIFLRSVQDDNTTVINTLHYITNGSAKLGFIYKKTAYYIPLILILKCLREVVDVFIYKALMAGYENNISYSTNIRNMIFELHEENLHWHEQCKAYLGKTFRTKFTENLPPDASDIDVCDYIIKNCIFIHLDDPIDKFNLLIFMTKKLFSFADNKCNPENVDSLMMQECLLGGYLYLQVLKEKICSWLSGIKTQILKRADSVGNLYTLTMQEILNITKFKSNVNSQMEYFLSTGNTKSNDLGLLQNSGFSVIVENINRTRYMSHFRAIHRGAFFQTLRLTEIRKLLPDAWGFICPVNTPDGTPCGLLNHLTMDCIITKQACSKLKAAIPLVLVDLGMIPLSIADWLNSWKDSYTVMLDGKVIGLIEDKIINEVICHMRILKIEGKEIPSTLEIVLIPKEKTSVQYPGLFLFTNACRMMRPVINLAAQKIELIGTFEQIFMDICVTSKEAHETYQETSKLNIFSNLANLIPLPDCNQSPRNMYQCQMSKQTMGTPCHNWQQQTQTTLYRLQTPNTPLFRPVHYDKIKMDDFPMGINAVVAIISYTGYDMEDAMIINKASFERGFGHGMIYKSEFIDLNDKKSYFHRDPSKSEELKKTIDIDGLPPPGIIIKKNDPYYCYYDAEKGEYFIGKYKGKENAYVDNVKLCGTLHSQDQPRACITFRIPRKAIVGDKFASRSGQKGILSQLYSAEDMPFSESGIIPDIIFNPHGFPSRMTIAKAYEMMAGKSAAIHGLVHDATPFRFDEKNLAVDYFGELLECGGYSYYGNETMYSGTHGLELNVKIFCGIVHYQRLRHMVSDKWQVRSAGPIDALTRQPIKGRRHGGGMRLGEMERDALFSHGCMNVLRDRLINCSDKTIVIICTNCNTLLGSDQIMTRFYEYKKCRTCGNKSIQEVEVPYIVKYLLTELISCNVNLTLDLIRKCLEINCRK